MHVGHHLRHQSARDHRVGREDVSLDEDAFLVHAVLVLAVLVLACFRRSCW